MCFVRADSVSCFKQSEMSLNQCLQVGIFDISFSFRTLTTCSRPDKLAKARRMQLWTLFLAMSMLARCAIMEDIQASRSASARSSERQEKIARSHASEWPTCKLRTLRWWAEL